MQKYKNTQNGYGVIARVLHWGMALSIVAMFGLGVWMRTLSYYDPMYKIGPDIHRSVGMLLVVLLIARLVWRIVNTEPSDDHLSKPERMISKLVHWAFYGLLFALFAAGYLITTLDGRSIEVFGLFSVPSLVQSPGLERFAGLAHEYLAYLLMGLVAVHGAAAMKHHFVDRDPTLTRMLSGDQTNTPVAPAKTSSADADTTAEFIPPHPNHS